MWGICGFVTSVLTVQHTNLHSPNRLTMPSYGLICLMITLGMSLQSAACKPINNPFKISPVLNDACPLPSTNDTGVNLSFCRMNGLSGIDWKKLQHMTYLNLSHNNLSTLDSDLFIANNKLIKVDLSFNQNLGKFQGTECFINSDTIKLLILSYSGFGVIHPRSMCLPKLQKLFLFGNSKCEETRKLFEEMKPSVKIFCGGTAPEPNKSISTLPPHHPQPPTTSGPVSTSGKPALHGDTTSKSSTSSAFPTSSPAETHSSRATSPQSSPVLTSPGAHDFISNSTTQPNKNDENPFRSVFILMSVVIPAIFIYTVYCCCEFRCTSRICDNFRRYARCVCDTLCRFLRYLGGMVSYAWAWLTNATNTRAAVMDANSQNTLDTKDIELNQEPPEMIKLFK